MVPYKVLSLMSRTFRQIIRIAGTNVDGTKKLAYALTEIKGVGIRLANIIVKKAGLDQDTRLGFLSDAGVKEIENIIEKPSKNDIPSWFLNRKKDRETGNDLHLIGPDIDLQVKSDIERMKKIKSWKGYRHSHGLKVRGQKTRTTGRTQKSLGVKKKKIIAEKRRL
jgi:small subunit ribosomal protein S13